MVYILGGSEAGEPVSMHGVNLYLRLGPDAQQSEYVLKNKQAVPSYILEVDFMNCKKKSSRPTVWCTCDMTPLRLVNQPPWCHLTLQPWTGRPDHVIRICPKE